jgi:hypothetical protein
MSKTVRDVPAEVRDLAFDLQEVLALLEGENHLFATTERTARDVVERVSSRLIVLAELLEKESGDCPISDLR